MSDNIEADVTEPIHSISPKDASIYMIIMYIEFLLLNRLDMDVPIKAVKPNIPAKIGYNSALSELNHPRLPFADWEIKAHNLFIV